MSDFGVGRRVIRILLAVAMGGLPALGPGPAMASEDGVHCGDVITTDTTLRADLVDCPGVGLVIGADGITLDLAGHVIDGAGYGVGVSTHRSGVRIQGGRIQQFTTGLFMGWRRYDPFPTGNVMRDLQIVDNENGVTLMYAGGNNALERSVVARNRVRGVEIALSLGGNRITRNVVAQNGEGIYLFVGRPENVVVGNRIARNAGDGLVLHADGPPEPPGAVAHQVRSNVFARNGADGMRLHGGTDTLVEANRALRNGEDGIGVDCFEAPCVPGPTLGRNAANGNAGLGIDADPGTNDGGGNRARRNGDPRECVGVACR